MGKIKIKNRGKEEFVIPEGAKVVSYATRGMETLRGLSFMRHFLECLMLMRLLI